MVIFIDQIFINLSLTKHSVEGLRENQKLGWVGRVIAQTRDQTFQTLDRTFSTFFFDKNTTHVVNFRLILSKI